jgi:hypothetical protein
MEAKTILPLLGVVIGWCLKQLSDYFVTRKQDQQTFRRATFYILKDWKALFDYDRGTTYFRKNRPSVGEFEPWRAVLEARYLEESESNTNSTSTAIDLLASVDPPLAVRLHNALRNMAYAFRRDLGQVASQDEDAYARLLSTQDGLVATTLNELRTAALHSARRSGIGQQRKAAAWIEERIAGQVDFAAGMREQAEIRNRAMELGREQDRGETES